MKATDIVLCASSDIPINVCMDQGDNPICMNELLDLALGLLSRHHLLLCFHDGPGNVTKAKRTSHGILMSFSSYSRNWRK